MLLGLGPSRRHFQSDAAALLAIMLGHLEVELPELAQDLLLLAGASASGAEPVGVPRSVWAKSRSSAAASLERKAAPRGRAVAIARAQRRGAHLCRAPQQEGKALASSNFQLPLGERTLHKLDQFGRCQFEIHGGRVRTGGRTTPTSGSPLARGLWATGLPPPTHFKPLPPNPVAAKEGPGATPLGHPLNAHQSARPSTSPKRGVRLIVY